MQQVNEILPEALFEALKQDKQNGGGTLMLLDIREPNEIAVAKIDGATCIPMGDIPNALNQIPMDKPVMIFCHKGVRSYKTGLYLIENGFEPELIFSLKGGIEAWSKTIDSSIPLY